jgi:putative DNA primase/helicase
MFLLCSIATALKQGADASRFAQLTLRNPSFLPQEQRQAHWLALDRDLAAVTPRHGHRLALRSVGLIPTIQASIAVFRRVAALRFDSQRQGDQYGSLLAGAWSLMSREVPTEADALGLIDSNDWSHYREASEQSDEHRCLQTILQHQIRVEADRGVTLSRTVSELVELVANPGLSVEISSAIAEAHLGRLGLRVEAGALLISNTALGIARILKETAWASSWATVLSRVTGAERYGVTRFRGLSGVSRAVRVPLASI